MRRTLRIQSLSSYVPRHVANRLVTSPGADLPLERIDGALLFVDLSGFTALTERLAPRGAEGLEDLIALLNGYFHKLVGLVHLHSGDVVKFAGDSVTVLWPADSTTGGLDAATERAAVCALEILSAFKALSPDRTLTPKIALSAGEVLATTVRPAPDQAEFIIAGGAVLDLAATAKRAERASVFVSPFAWTKLDKKATGDRLSDGTAQLVRMAGLPEPTGTADPPAEQGAKLNPFIPRAVLMRGDCGTGEWLAQLRKVTVLFMSLPAATDAASVEKLAQLVKTAGDVVQRFDGSVNKVALDEKGVFLIAAWGLPSQSHEDDAYRGVSAALNLHAALRGAHPRVAIGVATGQAFCGLVGSESRCEYTMIGDVVNVAARLMQWATADVVVADSTQKATRDDFVYGTPHELAIKGKLTPVVAYRPEGEGEGGAEVVHGIIGRDKERLQLSDNLQALVKGEAGAVVIEADAGLGKSQLAGSMIDEAEMLKVSVLLGCGDSIERSAPYFAWRTILRTLLGINRADLGPEEKRDRTVAALEQLSSGSASLAPLLSPLVGLELPESEHTAQITGEARQGRINELVVALLKKRAQSAPLLIVLDDAHWIDSASWALLRAVRQDVPRVLLVIATRPFPANEEPSELTALKSAALHIKLKSLSRPATYALIRHRLGAKQVAPEILTLILNKAEGHPFFTEELAFALRDGGMVKVAGDRCVLAQNAATLGALSFPDSVKDVVASRIDRLTQSQQLALKVASVIGRVFAFRTLQDIYPIAEERPRLAKDMETLEALDLTRKEPNARSLSYAFKHIITEEVSYNLMLPSQRQSLHRAAAEWYEQVHQKDLKRFYPLLAHHWAKADVKDKALGSLELAGEQALLNFANNEAIRFLSDAIALREVGGLPVSAVRQARLERLLGDAYWGLGRLEECRRHLTRSLKLLGLPVPEKPAGLIFGSLVEAVKQFARRTLKLKVTPAPNDERLLEASRAYSLLAELCFFANDALPLVYSVLRTLNLAERTGQARELARGAAELGVVAATVPAHGMAKSYGARAKLLTATAGDHATRGHVTRMTGMAAMGVADFAQAERDLADSLAVFEGLGDKRRRGETLALIAQLEQVKGNFQRCHDIYVDVERTATRFGDRQQREWGLSGQAFGCLRLGDVPRALLLLRQAAALSVETDRISKINTQATLAMALSKSGEALRAIQEADGVLALIQEGSPAAPVNLDGYADTAVVYLDALEKAPGDARLLAKATAAAKALDAYAKVFPIATSRALMVRGRLYFLARKEKKAEQRWRQAVTIAAKMGLPYDQKLAEEQLLRLLKPAA